MNVAERDLRTARLLDARRGSAARKQQQALDAISTVQASGACMTFAAVARAAGVSNWFVYNNATVRIAVNDAISATQAFHPQTGAAAVKDTRTEQGLRVDLADARDEIRSLRQDRELLRTRLERSLGGQVDAVSQVELRRQLDFLTSHHHGAVEELVALRAELARSLAETAAFKEELSGTRAALRRLMRENAVR